MKKLWIQYIMVILSAAMMMAVVPDFSDSIKSVQAQPDWQTDIPSEEETEFGDFVLPIPDQDQLSSTQSAADIEDMSSMVRSLFSSMPVSSKNSQSTSRVSSRRSSSVIQDPTASMTPIPSSKPSSASSKSSSASSKPQSSSASVTSSAPPLVEKKVWVTVNGKAQELALLEVLPQIVENEIGSSAEPEALKAQAVAAHTYIQYYNDRGNAPAVSLKAVYPANQAKMDAAIQAVADKIITVNGKAVYTPYCAASAGKTNSSVDVWGGPLSHLVSVESKYDNQDAKNWGTKKTIPVSEVKSLLETKGGITVSGKPEEWFKVINYTVGGYNKNMSVCGQTQCTINGKAQTITGRVLRENILSLKSAKFEVKVEGDQFIFTTYGYGHGVGMPQIGANLYAKNEKWSYQKILTHYYTGVTITTLK
ncbi:MAG: SpoIID/LytB domain-containing protein [Clostridiales bacterium]|nr:SpoIID/LytB domain-containing protein [Clostridiales bacterium]